MSARDAAIPAPRNRVGFTPNFDGVLNSGDSWVARRRASESSLKAGVGTSRDQGDQLDNKASEIQEEEEDGGQQHQSQEHGEEKSGVSQQHATSITGPSQSSNNVSLLDGQTVATDMARLSIGANDSTVKNITSNGPPPSIPDLASVEWSYKDPSGQIQGIYQSLSESSTFSFSI
jgi:PERQ amino acid-rich with GYF domain-containing protein